MALRGDLYAYAKLPFRCVQIRHFVEQDAVLLRSKQGISLKRKQWSTLIDIFKRIEEQQSTPKCTKLHQNQEDYFSCSFHFFCHNNNKENNVSAFTSCVAIKWFGVVHVCVCV